jgi:Arc/MetJ-type ribon-helix-helix transcriptional regulator
MEFKKVTVSLPANLYKKASFRVAKGYYSSISDFVRSGMRRELIGFYEYEELPEGAEERLYSDKELQRRVKEAERRYERGESIVCDVEDLRKEIESE